MNRFSLLLAALLALAAPAWAQSPRIAWDANPPSENVTGYLVYWGSTSRFSDGWTGYPNAMDVGNVTESPPITVSDVAFTWFAVVAYNAQGLLSDYSAEVYASPVVGPVDCVVDAWSAWGTCSQACGGGTQTRTRSILTPPANGGAACPALSEEQGCNTQACPPDPPPPVDCVVDVWSPWGTCSATCGGGTQTRTRAVVTPSSNGGAACPGLSEAQACNTQVCSAPRVSAPVKQIFRVPAPRRPSSGSGTRKVYPVPAPRKPYRR